MDKWLKVSIMVAVLAGAGGFYYFAFVLPGIEQERRSAIESCRQAAWMVYDVHWAVACAGHADGHAECDLPDAKAAVVNAWLNEAEQRCMAEVGIGLDP